MDYLGAVGASKADLLILKINSIIVNPLIITLFAFSLVAFLWGVFHYVEKADDSESRVTGAQHMLWGIIGMAIMLMSFTIIRIMLRTFGIYEQGSKESKETMQSVNKVLKPNIKP